MAIEPRKYRIDLGMWRIPNRLKMTSGQLKFYTPPLLKWSSQERASVACNFQSRLLKLNISSVIMHLVISHIVRYRIQPRLT